MDAHYIFPIFLSIYENFRAQSVGRLLGISALAVRLLDLVECLPGLELGDAERALGCGRAQALSAAFELQQAHFVDLSDVHGQPEEVRLQLARVQPAVAEARREAVRMLRRAEVNGDLTQLIERYQGVVLATLHEHESEASQLASAHLMRMLANRGQPLSWGTSGDHLIH